MPDRGVRFARLVALLGGITLVTFGAWAFFAPRSFYDTLAVFPPYNRHFIHDVGAFQIGLGAVLLLTKYGKDALFVALAGVGIGSAVHVASHIMDRNLGGNPETDIPLLTVLTLVLVAGAFAIRNASSSGDSSERSPAQRP